MIRSRSQSKWFEVKADCCLADTQQAGNLSLAPPHFHKSSDEGTTHFTFPRSAGVATSQMFGVPGAMQLQILNPVIGSVPVDVVDDLSRIQRAAQLDFHDPSVFEGRNQLAATPHRSTPVSLRGQMYADDLLRARPRPAVESCDAAVVGAVDATVSERSRTGLADGCHSHILHKLKTEYGRVWRPLLLAYLERVEVGE